MPTLAIFAETELEIWSSDYSPVFVRQFPSIPTKYRQFTEMRKNFLLNLIADSAFESLYIMRVCVQHNNRTTIGYAAPSLHSLAI